MDLTILIVDRHQAARQSLRHLFGAAGIEQEQIMEATHCDEALKTLCGQRVDVILLDLELSAEEGLDTLRAVKSRHGGAAVLMHSFHESDRLLSRCFHGGAGGYVMKGADKDALLSAVRQIATSGDSWTCEQLRRIQAVDANFGNMPS